MNDLATSVSTSLRARWQRLRRGAAAMLVAAAVSIAGCSGGSGEPETAASPLRVRLMTGKQYSTTLAYLFGSDISDAVPAPMPQLTRTDGLLAMGAASVGVTADQLQQLQQAATFVAAKVVDEQHREFLIPCKPENEKAADAACATKFIQQTGRLWYRHPLADAKVARLVKDAGDAADQLKDFYAGLASALEGMLVSPEALFIVDVAEPDPENKGKRRLNAYSLASRLSFFLWNSAPDDELLKAAESGELNTEKGRKRVVDSMLASSRVEDGVRAFFDDLMEFDVFASLAKDAMVYPTVTGGTLADAREQTLRTIVDHLITKKEDYRDLFTTRSTFMSMNLAAVYGVPTVNGWVPYEFPQDSLRSGLLTQISFLASHAHPARSSATRRGKALRELFLCQKVPSPPPNVDFSLLEDPNSNLKTARERLKVHATNASCAGCHLIMDPMGLALEKFDGAGSFRETENGAPLDTSGTLDGKQFKDVVGLGQALHDHPGLPTCLVNRVYSYGTGGPVAVAADRETLAFFAKRFADDGYRLPDLMREIALSKAFSHIREGKPAAAPKPAASVVKATVPAAVSAPNAEVSR
jgi:hypothetical protein